MTGNLLSSDHAVPTPLLGALGEPGRCPGRTHLEPQGVPCWAAPAPPTHPFPTGLSTPQGCITCGLAATSALQPPLARGLGWGWWGATSCPAFAPIFPTMKPLAHEGTSFVPIISPSLVSGYSSECRDFLVAGVQVESHAFA